MSRVKRALPLVILCSGLVLVSCLVWESIQRQRNLVDTGETRSVVEATVAGLQVQTPVTLDEPEFRQAVNDAARAQYVADVWLFDPKGRIVYQAGGGPDPSRFYEWATREMKTVIAALPQDVLDAKQKGALLAVCALRGAGGGDHNDVSRQMVRPVRSPDGTLVGWLGAAYDVNPGIGGPPSAGAVLLLAGILLGALAYKVSLVSWVFLDAKARGERAWVWMLFALVGDLVALIAYLLARAPRPQIAPPESDPSFRK